MVSFNYRAFWGPYAHARFHLEHFNPRDHIFRTIERTDNFYEQDLLYFLAQRLTPGGIYIDIGANVGNHSVFFAKFLADLVICVEPLPLHVEYLRKNLQQNGLVNFQIVQAGLYSEAGTGRLIHDPDTQNNSGMTRIEAVSQAGSQDSVRLMTLDSLTEAYRAQGQSIAVLKIDVEGLDYDVLRGGLETIRQSQPVVIFEAETQEEHRRIHELLAAEDYVYVAMFYQPGTYVYQSARKPRLQPQSFKMHVDNTLRRIHRRYVLWRHPQS